MFVTADQGIPYQQNMQNHKIALVVLSTNERSVVIAHVAQIVAAIHAAQTGSFTFIEIGH